MMSRYAIFALWVVVLGVTPFVSDNYVVRIAILVAMFTALAQSWNFIGGFAGYPSLSTAAFYGLGAYAGAISQGQGINMYVAWIIATVVVGVFAAGLGAIILRLRGHYFAIGSIATVEVLRLLISSASDWTGGGDGLNVPFLPGTPDFIAMFFLYVMVGLMVIVFVVAIFVDRGRLGFGLHCIHQNEDAAYMVGINTTQYKVIAYVLSAMFCGTVGAAYASWTGYIDPTDSFEIVMTIKVPVMVILGGAGTLMGPVVGAAAFVIMEEVIWGHSLDWNRGILGVLIVLLIMYMPGGLLRVSFANIRRRFKGSTTAPG